MRALYTVGFLVIFLIELLVEVFPLIAWIVAIVFFVLLGEPKS